MGLLFILFTLCRLLGLQASFKFLMHTLVVTSIPLVLTMLLAVGVNLNSFV